MALPLASHQNQLTPLWLSANSPIISNQATIIDSPLNDFATTINTNHTGGGMGNAQTTIALNSYPTATPYAFMTMNYNLSNTQPSIAFGLTGTPELTLTTSNATLFTPAEISNTSNGYYSSWSDSSFVLGFGSMSNVVMNTSGFATSNANYTIGATGQPISNIVCQNINGLPYSQGATQVRTIALTPGTFSGNNRIDTGTITLSAMTYSNAVWLVKLNFAASITAGAGSGVNCAVTFTNSASVVQNGNTLLYNLAGGMNYLTNIIYTSAATTETASVTVNWGGLVSSPTIYYSSLVITMYNIA